MVGTTIAQYEILASLGEGGMGAVYKARDTRLDRIVALKFITAGGNSSDEDCARLLREARVSAAINHPNVCAVLDIHQSKDANFLVMEYIDGHSLREEIARGPMEPARMLGLAVQVAEGLRAAHRKGFVHRDVKPENILLDAEGRPKVTDFGLARRVDLDGASDGASGTMAYMSPEQIRGEPVDRPTDVWSLGVVMYEMLAGRRPFAGEYRQALMYSIANEKPVPVADALASAGVKSPAPPAPVVQIINRCLEKMPSVRYADAEALVPELKDAARGLRHGASEGEKAIAVLPFEDLSSGGDNRYFSDGLTEEIIAGLSKLKSVRVISRTTVMRYDRTEKSAATIGQELGVHYLLEGSVRKRSQDVLITTRLIDAKADAQVWSEKYPGTMDDVFTIQESVAAKIAKALRIRLTPGEKRRLGRRPTDSAEAYQLYLKGRFEWNKRSREGIEASIGYFERAIRKDRKFALAWSGLGDAYNFLSEFVGVPRAETYPQARNAVDRALELDGELAEARTSLAGLHMLYERNWEAAEREFRLSLYLKPGYATTHHWLSELLMFTGRPDEALLEIDKAREIEPLSPAIARDRGILFYYLKRFDEAIDEGRRSLSGDRTFTGAHRLLSLAFLAKGMKDEAVAENKLWGDLGGNRIEASIWLAYISAVSGDTDEAKRLISAIPPKDISGGPRFRAMALVHVALGDHDRAIALLSKALSIRSEVVTSIGIDFKFDPLRGDPRFTDLLKKIGLAS